MSSENTVMIVHAKPERKVIKPGVRMLNKIPESILKDENIKEAISVLPTNYNFEIHKTIWRIKQLEAKRVALQMPEGLLLFATTIADIIERFTGADSVIMGDVTYGACCIDDFTASSLQVDLLVHYGHSCLIPIDRTSKLKILYVFVDIKIDISHFIETIKCNFDKNVRLCFVSTIQFVMTLQSVATELQGCGYTVKIPQLKPLSPGEILGCTAPVVGCVDAVIYLGDGRFHLEAAMIANPGIKMYRYDPYEKAFTQEFYEHNEMKKNRKQAIEIAKDGGRFGLILGTLGRQGSLKVLKYMQEKFKNNAKQTVIILLSEIFPDRLKLFTDLDAFIQTSCPRLSIDWGTAFSKPLLTPYEASVVIGEAQWSEDTEEFRYPMDFYANTSLGPWTPNHKERSYLKPCCGKCANT